MVLLWAARGRAREEDDVRGMATRARCISYAPVPSCLVFLSLLEQQEEELKQKFGAEYVKYVEKVPGRIFPSPNSLK